VFSARPRFGEPKGHVNEAMHIVTGIWISPKRFGRVKSIGLSTEVLGPVDQPHSSDGVIALEDGGLGVNSVV
jgi:hypothetical protein